MRQYEALIRLIISLLDSCFSGGYWSNPSKFTEMTERLPVNSKIGWNVLRTLQASEEFLSMLAVHKLLTDSEPLKLRCNKSVKHPVALLSSISIFMCKN